MPPPPPPPQPLPDELLEEIFLRLPPDEPACLVRASLATKFWLALISGRRFRGRYRDHHGALPILGFLSSSTTPKGNVPAAPPFVSTTGFRARVPGDGWGHRDYAAWDCRHGRVLLGESGWFMAMEGHTRWLAVWDPMSGRRLELREPHVVYGHGRYAAAVLCAVGGCDHLTCHDGPFRVVYFSLQRVAADDDFVAQAFVSSTDFHRVGEWSDPCPGISVCHDAYIEPRPPVLLNDALHFLLGHDAVDHVLSAEILKYDLTSHSLSLIDAPNERANMAKNSVLIAMEDGTLGFAHLNKLTLFIWSRDVGLDAWTQPRVIHLKTILPIRNPRMDVSLTASVEGSDVVFVTTRRGIYKINLKSLQHKKISNGEYLVSLIPYMSFCRP